MCPGEASPRLGAPGRGGAGPIIQTATTQSPNSGDSSHMPPQVHLTKVILPAFVKIQFYYLQKIHPTRSFLGSHFPSPALSQVGYGLVVQPLLKIPWSNSKRLHRLEIKIPFDIVWKCRQHLKLKESTCSWPWLLEKHRDDFPSDRMVTSERRQLLRGGAVQGRCCQSPRTVC